MLIDTCHSCDPFLYSTGLWVPNIPHGFSGIEHAVVRYRCIFLSCKVTWLDILLSSSTSGLPVSPIFFLPFLWSSSLLLSLLLLYPLLSLSFPSPSITPPFPPPFFLFFLSLSLCSNPPCPLLPWSSSSPSSQGLWVSVHQPWRFWGQSCTHSWKRSVYHFQSYSVRKFIINYPIIRGIPWNQNPLQEIWDYWGFDTYIIIMHAVYGEHCQIWYTSSEVIKSPTIGAASLGQLPPPFPPSPPHTPIILLFYCTGSSGA